jgi:hypothetical protein
MNTPAQRASIARRLPAEPVAIGAEDLESLRVVIVLDPSPQLRAVHATFARPNGMLIPVRVFVIDLKET